MIACSGCEHERQCAEKQLACRAYVNQGIRGSNPCQRWYLVMQGENVDYANRRIEGMADKVPVPKIADWIAENVSPRVIGDITLPAGIRPKLLRYLWRLIPSERLELEDFAVLCSNCTKS